MRTLYENNLNRFATWLTGATGDVLPTPADSPRRLLTQVMSIRKTAKLRMMLLGFVYAGVGLTVPLSNKFAIDDLTSSHLQQAGLWFVLGGSALLLTRGIQLTIQAMGMRESVVVERWLSQELYKKTLSLQAWQRGDRTIGEIVALMASHLSMVSFFLTELFPMLFVSFLPVILAPFILSYFFDLSPIPVFSVVAASLVILILFSINQSRIFQVYRKRDEVRLGTVNEWIQNIRPLRILGWISAFEAKIIRETKETVDKRVALVTWAQLMNSFAESVPHVLNIVGIMTLLLTREIPPTPGDVFGVLWVLAVFLNVPMRVIPWVFVLTIDASSSLGRIEEFLRLHPAKKQLPSNTHGLRPLVENRALVVENLSLVIQDTKLLHNVSFRVDGGDFVAIVGAVGAGKTLLIQSLLRETPSTFDRFEIFGHSYDSISSQDHRGLFALSPQETFTFGASIHENVAFDFDPAPEDGELSKRRSSLSHVEYETDLATFPDDLFTEIGERGVNLSGGQRQRLAMARSHYSDRKILMLDDSLSALDAETEDEIVKKLFAQEWGNKTILLVTHRLTVLPKVDHIIFLKEGRVEAQGKFEDLMNNSEFREFVKSLEVRSD